MTNKQGYAAYANNRIMTASADAIEKKDIAKAHENIVKVENIIEEFRATLNHKYPVAEDFENVYSYLNQRLVEANVKKDREILEEVLEHLRTMRDTWKEVMKQVGSGR